MNGRCWWPFSAPRSVRICFSGRQVKKLKKKRPQVSISLSQRRGATAVELQLRKMDVGVGTFFSNIVMFFIILTTAITLNRHGMTHIETTRQAAEALRPLAGRVAATLFTGGIVGVGFLAIPTLAGSAAYAFAETLGWRQGLDKKLKQARAFYTLILLSTGVGVGLDVAGINPVKALYWTAVINGLLAPFLLVAILVVASDRKLMQGQPSSRLGWIVVAMFAAGVAMFVVKTVESRCPGAARSPDTRVQRSDLPLCRLHQPNNNLLWWQTRSVEGRRSLDYPRQRSKSEVTASVSEEYLPEMEVNSM